MQKGTKPIKWDANKSKQMTHELRELKCDIQMKPKRNDEP